MPFTSFMWNPFTENGKEKTSYLEMAKMSFSFFWHGVVVCVLSPTQCRTTNRHFANRVKVNGNRKDKPILMVDLKPYTAENVPQDIYGPVGAFGKTAPNGS
jgi:hypothetical protein